MRERQIRKVEVHNSGDLLDLWVGSGGSGQYEGEPALQDQNGSEQYGENQTGAGQYGENQTGLGPYGEDKL